MVMTLPKDSGFQSINEESALARGQQRGGGLMRPAAVRTVEVVALGVVLFAAIAGQALAGAGPSEGADGCKITYGGRILAANGDKATFGGNVQSNKGQLEYQDHGPATDINVHSIDVQSVFCVSDAASAATIVGLATVNGDGSFEYRLDLVDFGEPGTTDTYRIQLSNGYDSGEQVLVGGNVQIH